MRLSARFRRSACNSVITAMISAMIWGLGFASQGVRAQGEVRNSYDDWQLRCETPAGAKAEQCALALGNVL